MLLRPEASWKSNIQYPPSFMYSEAGCPIDLRLAKFNIPSAPSVSTNIQEGDSFRRTFYTEPQIFRAIVWITSGIPLILKLTNQDIIF
jgi:hypothetical protein